MTRPHIMKGVQLTRHGGLEAGVWKENIPVPATGATGTSIMDNTLFDGPDHIREIARCQKRAGQQSFAEHHHVDARHRASLWFSQRVFIALQRVLRHHPA